MITLEGFKNTFRRFLGLEKDLKNPSNAMNRIAIISWKNVLSHFDTEIDSKGNPWPKWKKRTATGIERVSSRPTKRGGTKLLQDTGRLRNSILYRAARKTASVFIKLKYASVHNFGSKNKNIDKREYMYLDKATRDKIRNTFVKMIIKG
jgi:phage gpG-like protein